jgi:uncharacterized membrane-anchored protein YitT (DUF2179 family)/predicted metal-dependent HD superfamily phosphohydrolase
MQLEKLESFILEKLHKNLPHYLAYHNANHTEEVIQHAMELGNGEGLSDYELSILRTAAILHDSGFLISNIDHEKYSCQIAREYLPGYDYTQEEIEQICRIIMTTQIPQSAFDKISRVLCDADIYYLGTNDYQLHSGRLFRELKHFTPDISNESWLRQQINFLESHSYFTNTAKKKLNARKKLNLRHVKTSLKQHNQSHNDFRLADIILMVTGSFIASFAFKSFLIPNHFLDGGVTGISLLLTAVYHFDFPTTLILVNIPLIILGVYVVSKKFAVKTFSSLIIVSLCTHFIHFPEIVMASDRVLIAIFGGFFVGVGLGLNIRAGSAMDGIEVLAVYTLKRSSFTMTEIVLFINAIIFIIAGFHFTIETALYSMLTYFTATKTADYVVEGIEAYTGVTIISAYSEHIKEKLVNEMGRGITIYKGERGFLPGKYEIHSDVDIIFTVITRLELRKLKNLVYAEDPKAFIFASTIKETTGGVLKRRTSH